MEQRQYTRKERLLNWLYYHVWHLVAVGFLLVVLISMIIGKVALNQEGYDYYFAYVGEEAIGAEDVRSLETLLASLGQDVNGDGLVTVRVNQFIAGNEVTNEDASYGRAAHVAMLTDIEEGQSYFYLLEDPETFQLEYQMVAELDGSPSEDEDYTVWDKVYAWNDCPVLAAAKENSGVAGDFAQLLDRLYLGRRCFVNTGMKINSPENDDFWQILTENATLKK